MVKGTIDENGYDSYNRLILNSFDEHCYIGQNWNTLSIINIFKISAVKCIKETEKLTLILAMHFKTDRIFLKCIQIGDYIPYYMDHKPWFIWYINYIVCWTTTFFSGDLSICEVAYHTQNVIWTLQCDVHHMKRFKSSQYPSNAFQMQFDWYHTYCVDYAA